LKIKVYYSKINHIICFFNEIIHINIK